MKIYIHAVQYPQSTEHLTFSPERLPDTKDRRFIGTTEMDVTPVPTPREEMEARHNREYNQEQERLDARYAGPQMVCSHRLAMYELGNRHAAERRELEAKEEK